ncbi:MAG TPA: hypothetical protein ENH82_00475 [bacterium]|nr:hypothetical protein [bacterium]
MKTKLFLLLIVITTSLVISGYGFSEDDIYYARCNLKVIKGNRMTWVNWQSTRTVVPVGTKFHISKGGRKATLVDAATDKNYILDIGNEGDIYLEKFVIKEKVDLNKFSENVQRDIEKAFAKIGMTKEQVYITMGPPSWAGEKTHSMTYKQIMVEDLWVYKRKRFGKNIGVSFDNKTGKVDRTEGIWGR